MRWLDAQCGRGKHAVVGTGKTGTAAQGTEERTSVARLGYGALGRTIKLDRNWCAWFASALGLCMQE